MRVTLTVGELVTISKNNLISSGIRLIREMNSLSLHSLFAVVICLFKVHVSFQTQLTIQRLPTLREKSLLLVRMMVNYEKRFPEDFELQAQFLELVNYVYRLENKENYSKLQLI